MASWKKVHVDGADTTHGTITATLTDNATAIGNGTELELVVSESNELKTRTITFGGNAFNNTTIGTTTAALTDGAGIGDFSFNGSGTATVAVDIANATDLGSSVTSSDSILVADADASNAVKRCTLAQAIASVGAGVTSFTAGTNLTEDGGDTEGALVVNLDADLVDMASMSADHIAAGVTDGAGNDLTFNGGQGTGTGVGGDIFFKVAAVAASSATTVNALATALTIAAPTTSTGNSTVTVAGDLVVSGTTTTVNTTNLEVQDQFILLNNANSATDADGGIVIEGSTKSVAFGYDQNADRFAFDKTGATSGMTAIGNDAYFVHAHTAAGAAGQDTDFNQYGNIYVNSDNSDIYIYA